MEAIYAFDWSVFAWVRETLWNPVLDVIMKYITLLGEGGVIWIILAVGLICTKRYRKCGIAMGAALIIMVIFNDAILKNLICRPRPFNLYDSNPELFPMWKDFNDAIFPNIVSRPTSYSFPSGHSSSSFAAMLPLLKEDKRLGIPALILAILIAFSRVYVHVHYATDVIVGALVGILYALVAMAIVKKLYPIVEAKIKESRAKKNKA